MESSNIHRKHPLRGHQLVASSTLDFSPTFAAAHAPWKPSTILNNNSGQGILGSIRLQNDHVLVSSLNGVNSIMTQDLMGFNDWPNNGTAQFLTNHQSNSNNDRLQQIKRELSDSCNYSKFSEMINSSIPCPSSGSGIEDMQTDHTMMISSTTDHDIDDINVKLLLRTLSTTTSGGAAGQTGQSSSGLNIQSLSPHEEFYCTSSSSNSSSCGAANYMNNSMRSGTFSHIHPTINVSNFNLQASFGASPSSTGFDMNLQALDLFQSSRFSAGRSFRHSLREDQLDLSKNGLSYGGLDNYMNRSIQSPLDSSNITSFNNGVAEAKRSDINILERKAPQAASKRSRLDQSRASCPPFKVRKEKLGDRIAALQQLVAPFGKTDTASVLMEAIGYIKFLQNQVETLSVPYLKSSRNKANRAVIKGGGGENGSEERKRDLQSRGLCLVPLSCLSYVADGGGGIWPPSPNFGGGT